MGKWVQVTCELTHGQPWIYITKHALVIDWNGLHTAIPNGAANAVDPDIYSQKFINETVC